MYCMAGMMTIAEIKLRKVVINWFDEYEYSRKNQYFRLVNALKLLISVSMCGIRY